LAPDHASFAHLLIAGIEDEVREGLGKQALGKSLEAFVQPLVDRRNRRSGEGMPTQFFSDRLHLPCRDTLDVHLRQGRNEGLFRTLVTLEQLGGKAARTILRHAQFQLANAGGQRAAITPNG